MDYEIYYFEDDKGNAPVREYIKVLPDQDRAKIYAYLNRLSEVGPQMRRPMADYIGEKTGLYELRPSRHRIIYFFLERKNIILLHALLKKTDKIPEKDLRIAEDRKDICEVLKKYRMVDFEEFENDN